MSSGSVDLGQNFGGGSGGSGTVTSVGLADISSTPIFTVTGSPVTTTGTINLALKNENANTVFAGPSSGGAAQPTFRALVFADLPAGAGTGSVTSVSVTTGNGVSATVTNPTTTPALAFTLGAITPSSVAASGTVTGSNLSGTNTGDQTITLTGDVTGSGTGSFAATIAANAVTNAKAAQMANNTIKSNVSGGTANAADNTFATLAAATVTISSNANAKGIANTFALSDHTHQLSAGAAVLDSLPQYDATNWQATLPEAILNPSRALVLIDDFVGADMSGAGGGFVGQLGWAQRVSGAGSGAIIASTTVVNHPGVAQITTGTTTTGQGGMWLGVGGGGGSFLLGGGAIHMETDINIPVLGIAAQQYGFTFGLSDMNNTVTPTNTVSFLYQQGTTGNFWVLQTNAASVGVPITSTTAIAAATWYKLAIDINAAATSVNFSVNGVVILTTALTIPTAVDVAPTYTIIKTAGTTARTILIDYFYLNQRFTTAR